MGKGYDRLGKDPKGIDLHVFVRTTLREEKPPGEFRQ
jgi:hypothetical protein